MLLTIATILLIIWLLGFTVVHIGALIHILLIVALVVIVADYLDRRSNPKI